MKIKLFKLIKSKMDKKSESKKGKLNPMYGIEPWNKGIKTGIAPSNKGKAGLYKPTEETKEKQRIASTGKPSPNLGKKLSKEWREKIGLSNKNKHTGKGELKGENSPAWKGGISTSYSSPKFKIKHSDKYKQWRQDIFYKR